MNAKVAALACSLVVVPHMGKSAVYYFSGNGASNERGFLISDPANWENLAEITPTTEILGLRNSATKKCVLSLDDDLSIKRWSVECVDNKDMVFDFSPYALNASGICSGASRSGNRLLLKSVTLTVDWPKDRDEPVVLAQSQGTLSIDDATLASMQSGLLPDLKLKVTGQSIELRKRRGILMIVR